MKKIIITLIINFLFMTTLQAKFEVFNKQNERDEHISFCERIEDGLNNHLISFDECIDSKIEAIEKEGHFFVKLTYYDEENSTVIKVFPFSWIDLASVEYSIKDPFDFIEAEGLMSSLKKTLMLLNRKVNGRIKNMLKPIVKLSDGDQKKTRILLNNR